MSKSDKGDALQRALEYENFSFEKIVFIDDKMLNVKSLDKICKEEGMEFLGIQFTQY